ncbi:hypothetical protein MKW92_023899 [Papaver armeniacum]|nr:hypothetical protein MKW92_023899 [Papaver armeniacum]
MAARVFLRYYMVLVLMITLCLFLNNNHTSTDSVVVRHPSRKLILHDSMEEEVLASFQPVGHNFGTKTQDVDSLRTVPSGPDPLHHHGSSPKKPQTP